MAPRVPRARRLINSLYLYLTHLNTDTQTHRHTDTQTLTNTHTHTHTRTHTLLVDELHSSWAWRVGVAVHAIGTGHNAVGYTGKQAGGERAESETRVQPLALYSSARQAGNTGIAVRGWLRNQHM